MRFTLNRGRRVGDVRGRVRGREAYALAEGAGLEGPERDDEIAPLQQDFRSYTVDDLPPDVADGAEQPGAGAGRRVAAKERLLTRRHHLTDWDVQRCG